MRIATLRNSLNVPSKKSETNEKSQKMPGTLPEHLGWLSEAGFGTVEVYWKQMDLALLSGRRVSVDATLDQ